MKTIIAGSRGITDMSVLLQAVKECGWEVTHVVSGAARGADRLGEDFARSRQLPLTVFHAEWDYYGKSAGYRRNVTMAENAEALIALWDGKSPGTGHMINIARQKGLKVFVYYKAL
jgi:hypothetical protein